MAFQIFLMLYCVRFFNRALRRSSKTGIGSKHENENSSEVQINKNEHKIDDKIINKANNLSKCIV